MLQTFFQLMQLGGSYGYHNHRADRGACRPKSNIEDGALAVNYFHRKFHLRCLTVFWMGLWAINGECQILGKWDL